MQSVPIDGEDGRPGIIPDGRLILSPGPLLLQILTSSPLSRAHALEYGERCTLTLRALGNNTPVQTSIPPYPVALLRPPFQPNLNPHLQNSPAPLARGHNELLEVRSGLNVRVPVRPQPPHVRVPPDARPGPVPLLPIRRRQQLRGVPGYPRGVQPRELGLVDVSA